MPLATPGQYAQMLDAAERRYAYAAVNVTSLETLNAALRGFQLADADGIIQITVGAGEYRSGTGANDALLGARALDLADEGARFVIRDRDMDRLAQELSQPASAGTQSPRARSRIRNGPRSGPARRAESHLGRVAWGGLRARDRSVESGLWTTRDPV